MAMEMDDLRTRLLSTPPGGNLAAGDERGRARRSFCVASLKNEACTDKVAASQTFFLQDFFKTLCLALTRLLPPRPPALDSRGCCFPDLLP